MRGVEVAFDRRLLRQSDRPLAVALSGGGDSVALTLMTDTWARAGGRRLIILTVDHGLQAGSGAWVDACAALAGRLGHPFRALAWTGDKPTTGLPAAARAARHRLLADAAREAGARVLLMGHTADDVLEARAMREAGSTTPDAREWASSPAWPEGRGLFVLRPLLDLRRTELRDGLAARGESWIEDPANADPRYARSRARAGLKTSTSPPREDPPALGLADLAAHRPGLIALPRAALSDAAPEALQRLVGLAAVCAGGGDRRPAAGRIRRVADVLRGARPLLATLAGARIEADETEVRLFRDAGEFARGGARPGWEQVWDGRFELAAAAGVRPLAGLASRLPDDQRRMLRELPAAARGGLPALVDPDGAVTCPALTGAARDLIPDRLRAAAGLIDREPA